MASLRQVGHTRLGSRLRRSVSADNLMTFPKQYPNLEFVVSDQASGLRKGVNACGREIAHQ